MWRIYRRKSFYLLRSGGETGQVKLRTTASILRTHMSVHIHFFSSTTIVRDKLTVGLYTDFVRKPPL